MSSFGDWTALSDVCDDVTATLLKREVSDGIIAPGYTDGALRILKEKKRGNYNIIKIDPSYVPDGTEKKQVYGITFEQKRNDYKVTEEAFSNIVTRNRNLTTDAKRDLIVALITLKYTQSNSVAYAKDGQTIGVGAGQQSRIHCTRLAGGKADLWHLRQAPKAVELPFLDDLGRPERDNATDIYLGDEYMDVLADGAWQVLFARRVEHVQSRVREELVLKRDEAVIQVLGSERTPEDEQQRSVVGNVIVGATCLAARVDDALSNRVTRHDNLGLRADAALEGVNGNRQRDAHAVGLTSQQPVRKSGHRVLLVKYAGDPLGMAASEQRHLDVGAKADRYVGGTVDIEVVIDPPLCPVHAPKRRGKRPRTRAIEAGHLDRHKGKTHLRHERCLKTGGLAKERKLVPTPFQLLGKGKGWVDVAGCPPSRDGDVHRVGHGDQLLLPRSSLMPRALDLGCLDRSRSEALGPRSMRLLPEGSTLTRPGRPGDEASRSARPPPTSLSVE